MDRPGRMGSGKAPDSKPAALKTRNSTKEKIQRVLI